MQDLSGAHHTWRRSRRSFLVVAQLLDLAADDRLSEIRWRVVGELLSLSFFASMSKHALVRDGGELRAARALSAFIKAEGRRSAVAVVVGGALSTLVQALRAITTKVTEKMRRIVTGSTFEKGSRKPVSSD
jgi:hypothetical protein